MDSLPSVMCSRVPVLVFVLVLLFALVHSANTQAAAGDSISNIATLNYVIGGVPGSVESSPTGNATPGPGNGTPTTFIEDRIVNFIVTAVDASAVSVTSGQVNAVTTFTVTNTGNATHDFLLTAVNTTPNPFGTPADNIDPVPPLQVFVEDGTTPGYQQVEDTDVFIDELAIGATQTAYIVVTMPVAVAADVAAVALVAQVAEGGVAATEGAAINNDDNANTSPAGTYSNGATAVPAGTATDIPDTAGMDTVFNDPAGAAAEDVDSTGLAQDVAQNGQHSDASAYEVAGSPVIITKSVTVIDTLGGTDPHPGSTLRYTLDVTVIGGSNVNNLVVTDPVPANTTYTPGSITLNGVVQTDVNDPPTDYSQFSGTAVIVDLSEAGAVSIAPGTPNQIIFEVTID